MEPAVLSRRRKPKCRELHAGALSAKADKTWRSPKDGGHALERHDDTVERGVAVNKIDAF